MIPWLQADTPFPAVEQALTDADGADGLLAAGADLSPQRLLLAYHQGIFPWFSDGQPILWWSTDPRMVLLCDRFTVSQSLQKKLRQVAHSMRDGGEWQIRFDSAFTDVMLACAAPRRDGAGTWISNEIVNAYTQLHRLGYTHSSELWHRGELVGGAYGVGIGHMFFGESMFARVSDASKIALAYLVAFLKTHGVKMIDCQQQTAHLSTLGAFPIARAEFLAHVRQAVAQPQIKDWTPPVLY
jgi:leucyl/phenylalanyl-tRNA---protein transferase